jgi:hypothetical protein
VAAGVAGDDELESLGKGAASRRTIAGEGGQHFARFEFPHLCRVVISRRDHQLSVRRHRHASDPSGVAGESAELAPAG